MWSLACKHALHLQLLLLQGHLLLHQLHLHLHLLWGHVACVHLLHHHGLLALRWHHHRLLALWCHHHRLAVCWHHNGLLVHFLASHEWHASIVRSDIGNCLVIKLFDRRVALHALHHLRLVHLLLLLEKLLLILVRRVQLTLDVRKVSACQLHLLLGGLDALELHPGFLREAVLAAHLHHPPSIHPKVNHHIDGKAEVDPVKGCNSSFVAPIALPG